MSNQKGTLKISVSHLMHGTFSHRNIKVWVPVKMHACHSSISMNIYQMLAY